MLYTTIKVASILSVPFRHAISIVLCFLLIIHLSQLSHGNYVNNYTDECKYCQLSIMEANAMFP